MPLPIYTSAAFTNGSGVSVASNASVEVRRESDGSLVPIFEDRDGQNQITQPGFQADEDGRFFFYAESPQEGWEITVTSGADEHTLNGQFPQGGVFGIPEGEEIESQSGAQLKVDEHSFEQGGVHGIPAGERALHTGDSFGAGVPIGGYVTVQTDLTGAEEPDPETHIKLEAGLTGAGDYNGGKLDNESVSGSAPLVEATAEIVDAESPLNGQVVHLLETERRFLRAGEAGTVENDQMQRVTGSFTATSGSDGNVPFDITRATNTSGAIGTSGDSYNRTTGSNSNSVDSGGDVTFNSSDSPDARASSTTDGETRAKNIGVSVYMRIK